MKVKLSKIIKLIESKTGKKVMLKERFSFNQVDEIEKIAKSVEPGAEVVVKFKGEVIKLLDNKQSEPDKWKNTAEELIKLLQKKGYEGYKLSNYGKTGCSIQIN